jgi:hypothetical protein
MIKNGIKSTINVCPCSRFIQRKADELPYHLEKLEDRDRLKQCLSHKDIFDELYTDDGKQQLMAYWHFAASYEVAAEEYMRVMNDHIQVGHTL